MSAPDIILLTPNGRFELGKKVRKKTRLQLLEPRLIEVYFFARL